MKIDILEQPDPDIFRDRKKYILWFVFYLVLACVAVGTGVVAVYGDAYHFKNLENWALGVLVGSSLGITRFGNRLQAYKKLFPPQREKIIELRSTHPAIEKYCAQVEASGRGLIRIEFEVCVQYSEKHSAVSCV